MASFTRRGALQVLAAGMGSASGATAIDRKALVERHNPTLRAFDPHSPLSVGNGELAFTADVTGLQTFPELYEGGTPLCTLSQWGWNSFPKPEGVDPDRFRLTPLKTFGRDVGYPISGQGQEAAYNWLRENPHRFHLGRIGFIFALPGGKLALPTDITAIEQTLDLWTGTLHSSFQAGGVAVRVQTAVHPEHDSVIVSVESELIRQKRLAILFEFPYSSPAMNAADWGADAEHSTGVEYGHFEFLFRRNLDALKYGVAVSVAQLVEFKETGPHRFLLRPPALAHGLIFRCQFLHHQGPPPAGGLLAHQGDFKETAGHWRRFWSTGGAIDLSGASDPRAHELERRIMLSQYLTAIQCSGRLPPQETGLTCNSWNGKFHLEMHWWHAAHFALWGRGALLERSLPWYTRILDKARRTAAQEGYRGARWPKMVAFDGIESPSNIGPLLIWQQPHPIWMAELCYRAHPRPGFLKQYCEIVFDSAEFMASFAVRDAGRYVLGPPVIPAQENHPPSETWNPTFELEYWAHGLQIAQEWRRRLGLPPNPQWDDVREHLAALPVRDGLYLAHENCPQTFTERNRDHPSMLGALGLLPGAKADPETMRRTLHKVLEVWRWPDTWGWDYPMIAMTAARLGEPETAIDALLMDTPKNQWAANGHTPQRANLPCYLPSNGALLLAVAMMATGRGFPAKWNARHEGLLALL